MAELTLNDALNVLDQDEEKKKERQKPAAALLSVEDALAATDDVTGQRVRGEAFKAVRENPDQYAKDRALAERAQLPVKAIQGDKQKVVENRLKLEDVMGAIDSSPSLKRFAETPGNLALAHDDVGALTRIADVGRAFAGTGIVDTPGMTLRGLGAINESAGRMIERPITAGLRSIGLDDVAGFIEAPGIPWWLNPSEILARPGEQLGRVAEVVAPPEERRNFATDVGAGVGQLAAQITAAILTSGVSSTTMLVGQGASIQADMAEEAGKAGTTGADTAILLGGGITALTEKFGIDLLLKRIPAKARNRIMQMFMSAGTEASQEVVEGVVQRLSALALYDPDAEIFDGIEREGAVAGTVGAIAGLVLPGRTATRSQRSSAALEEMNGIESELQKRDPAKFAEYKGQVLRDNGVETISIDSDAVTEFAQSGGDMSWVENLGLTEEGAFELEQVLGSNIELTPEQYAAMPVEVQQALKDHTAINEDMTKQEADDYLASGVQEDFERMSESEQFQDSEVSGDFDFIKDKVQQQLEAIGYDASVAESFATLEAQRAVVRAEAAGQSPLELWASRPTVFVGPEGQQSEVVDRLSIDLDKIRSGATAEDFLRLGKRNVINEIIDRGGLDPEGTTAGELKARDITPANAPGLFREGGMDVANNIVASEIPLFADQQFGEEFNTFVPTDTLIDAIEAEASGTPLRSLDEQEQIEGFNAGVANLESVLEASGLTVESSDAEIRAALQEQEATGEGREFEQKNRASIRFEPDRVVINLPGSSDLSSFLHEGGHKWLEELRGDSLQFGQDNQQLANDWNTVVDWWGENAAELKAEAIKIASKANDQDAVSALAAMSDKDVKAFTRTGNLGATAQLGVTDATGYISVAMHEQWARGTEDYFRTGNAPSVALQDVFNTFKAWLVSIYSAMKVRLGTDALNVQFTPEVRAVLDRMLATEEEIALVQGQYDMAAIFTSPAEAGMTQKQFETYQRDVDRQVARAKERQLAKHVRSAERAKKQWWEIERAKVEAQVAQEVAATPAYAAVFGIINGTDPLGNPLPDGLRPMRLNRRDVDLEFENADSADRLPQIGSKKIFARGEEGSVSPDVLAPAYGYDSGLDMLIDIANHVDNSGGSPQLNMAQVVEAQTEARMKEQFGSMELTQQAREEAIESVHSDERGSVLLNELNALRDSKEKLKTSFVRQWAREQLVKHKVGDIKPSRYLAKQRKYARLASKALKAGDRVEAARMKFREALNFHMAQQSYKQRAQLAKDQKYLKKFSAKKTNFKNIEAEYVARIKSILGAYQLGPRLSDGKRNDLEKEAFTLWIARAKKDDGAVLMVPQEILNADNNTHFRDLTLEEWQTLVATIKNIEAQGRNAKKAIRADEMLQKEQVVDAILETMDRLKVTGVSRRAQNTKPAFYDPALHRLKEFDASMTKIEFLVEFLDGGVNGAAHEAIFQPFANAENAENLIVRAQSEQFAKLYQSIPKDQRTNMHKLRWNAALGRNVSRSELLHMALNVGNDSNLSKMARGSAKTKNELPAFSEEQALEAVEALSKEEWVFIQGVWDLFEAQRPAVEEVFKRENGDVMTNVPSREIVLPHGTYKGGYFPMIYDPAESSQAQKIEDKSALEMMASEIVQAGVFSGMTKERNEGFSAPVLLDITRVAGELQKTAHFITHYEAVRSTKKIIGDPRFEKAVVQKMGNEYYRILDLWVGQVAAGGRAGKVPGDTVGNIVEQFRSNATVASMGGLIGGSVTTILSQPLGVTTSIDALSRGPDGSYRPDLGALRMLKGYLGMMTPGGARAAMAASKELPSRLQNSDRDIKHVLSQLQGTRGSKAQIQRMMLIGIPFVQLYVVDMPTFIAAYNAGLKNGMGDGDAVNYADSLIRKAQGSGSVKDLSLMMAQRGTARAFTMFMTFFNTLYNIQRRLGREAEWTPTFANKVVSGSILLYVIPSMVEGLFRMEGPDDDESYAEWLALQAALTATSTVPLVRDVVSGALGNFGYGATPLEGFGNSVATMVNSVGKMIEDDSDLEMKDLKGAVSLLGFGTGRVPSSFINRIIRTFESMEAGEDPGIWSFFVGPKRE